MLNANYLLALLRDAYDLPYDRLCMHEFVLSARTLKREHGVTALDVAKRLMDYGFHPPTIYFPLVVPEALMIEPTETEAKETLDEFADAMKAIAREAARRARTAARGAALAAGRPARRSQGREAARREARLRGSPRRGARKPDSDLAARSTRSRGGLILAAAESETLRGFVRRHGMRFGAKRFVAGETFEAAAPVLRELNERGLLTNTTLLGEGVRVPAETRAVVEEYERVLDGIHRENLRTNVAIKPTHLGLALDEELAYENVAASRRTPPSTATSCGWTWRSRATSIRRWPSTDGSAQRDRQRRHRLQAYLYRTERDLESS